MKQDVLQDADKYMKERRRKKWWHKVVISLAAIVVFCTTYALILPAVTLEKDAPAEEEQAGEVMKVSEVEGEISTPKFAPITNDSAFVYELTSDGSSVLSIREESQCRLLSVRENDKIQYDFSVQTKSYTDESFGEGRVKFEFVLPMTSEEAAFDLKSMEWLDDSDKYAPIVSEEERLVGEQRVVCQVLTGYKNLASKDGTPVIPGKFSEQVVVTLKKAEAGESFSLQISAAMENSSWNEICEKHHSRETCTVTSDKYTVLTSVTEEEEQEIYERFSQEIDELEKLGELDEGGHQTAEKLLDRIQEAYNLGLLTEEKYVKLCDRVNGLLDDEEQETIAEAAEGTNWMRLRDSGWFEEYSDSGNSSDVNTVTETMTAKKLKASADEGEVAEAGNVPPSDVQVNGRGGEKTSEDGTVTVSKTISGTDLENVFDITLRVQTNQNISEVANEPDMAVVIVMDISNTMNTNFCGVTRYAAAMTAAEQFLDSFADNNTLGVSKVGYVAFNTDAHKIFGLQKCTNENDANALKNTMRTETGKIINASGYSSSHSRFTNIEAGLAMASDMLNAVTNKNKFIIFLSDGFPTTYISSGYSGYDPYDSTGRRFYDHVLNKKCLYGTSYSDEAAIRARNKAKAIKGSGTMIFSIGVDVGGQTIQTYVHQSENANGFSVVDRTSTRYEIGDAESDASYKNWLRNRIGSGYYYDSTDSTGLNNAFKTIFEEIKKKTIAGSQADWVAADPIPISGAVANVEFIGLYDIKDKLVDGPLSGSNEEGAENTAKFVSEKKAIDWDLKQSGYQKSGEGLTTTYTYHLVYRVRLKNEECSFGEGTVYPTNATTTLHYRIIEGTEENLKISDPKTVDFPIPSVKGYVSELSFDKVDNHENPLAGAEFTLRHDTTKCAECRGDGKSVRVKDMTALSGPDGKVKFESIPSGHTYVLTETKVPDDYTTTGDIYWVVVAYDKVKVEVLASDKKTKKEWDGKIVNNIYYELPNTGGTGTIPYAAGGVLLISASGFLLYIHIKRRKEGIASS